MKTPQPDCRIDRMHQEEGGEKNHSCESCDKSFIFPESLSMHKRSNCSSDIGSVNCGKCDKKHLKSMPCYGPDFKCETCGKKFGSNPKLKDHIWQCHSQVTCEICGKQVNNPNKLKRHKIFVHNDTKGVLFCKKCPKAAKALFFSQSTYDKHMKGKH